MIRLYFLLVASCAAVDQCPSATSPPPCSSGCAVADCLDASDLGDDAVRAAVDRARRPMLIRGLVPRIVGEGSAAAAWTPEALADRWGDFEVVTQSNAVVGLGLSAWDLQAGWGAAVEEVKEPLRSYLGRAASTASGSANGSAIDGALVPPVLFVNSESHPALLAKVQALPSVAMPPFSMAADKRHYALLSVGGSAAGLPLHSHGDAWLAQLHGSKSWWFLPPSADLAALPPALYRALFVQPASAWASSLLGADDCTGGGGRCPQRCDFGAGDTVVIPRGWHHSTANTGGGVGVALGGQRFGGALSPDMYDELVQEAEDLVAAAGGGAHTPARTAVQNDPYTQSVVSRKLLLLAHALEERTEKGAGDDARLQRGRNLATELIRRSAAAHPLHLELARAAIAALLDVGALLDAYGALHRLSQQLNACFQEGLLSSTVVLALLADMAEPWHRRTHPGAIMEHGNDAEWWLLGAKTSGLPFWLKGVYATALRRMPAHVAAKAGMQLWDDQFSS